MLKKLALLLVAMTLAGPALAKTKKPCPKGQIREYSCKQGTGPGSKGNKPCVKVPGKCVPKPPAPK
jgi:hypothetical protein